MYMVTCTDITRRKRAEEELHVREEEYRIATENSGRIVYRYLIDEKKVELTKRISLLFGLPAVMTDVPESVIALDKICPESVDEYRRFYDNICNGNDCDRDWRISRAACDGGIRWMKMRYITVRDDSGHPASAIIHFDDITCEHELENNLTLRARTDGLTGIYNKTVSEELSGEELKDTSGKRFAMLMIDLDNFKGVNDTLGHHEGDRALKLVASTLKSHFRKTDIVGRVGGDEFVVFIKDAPNETVLHAIITAMMHDLKNRKIGEANDSSIHCSIGGAYGTAGIDDYLSVSKRADKALYHVKRNGKDDYMMYTPDMENENYKYISHDWLSLRRSEWFEGAEMKKLLESVAYNFRLRFR